MIKDVRYLRDTICIKRALMKYNVLFSKVIYRSVGKMVKRVTSIKQLPWHYMLVQLRDHGCTMSALIDRETRLLIIRDRFEPMHVGVKWLPGTEEKPLFCRTSSSVGKVRGWATDIIDPCLDSVDPRRESWPSSRDSIELPPLCDLRRGGRLPLLFVRTFPSKRIDCPTLCIAQIKDLVKKWIMGRRFRK